MSQTILLQSLRLMCDPAHSLMRASALRPERFAIAGQLDARRVDGCSRGLRTATQPIPARISSTPTGLAAIAVRSRIVHIDADAFA